MRYCVMFFTFFYVLTCVTFFFVLPLDDIVQSSIQPEGPGADSSMVSRGLCIVNFNLCISVRICDIVWCVLHVSIFHYFPLFFSPPARRGLLDLSRFYVRRAASPSCCPSFLPSFLPCFLPRRASFRKGKWFNHELDVVSNVKGFALRDDNVSSLCQHCPFSWLQWFPSTRQVPPIASPFLCTNLAMWWTSVASCELMRVV